MIDLQSSSSSFPIAINKVGVKDILHPVTVKINDSLQHPTNAKFNIYVDLKEDKRGTHMSRFLEILNQQSWELSIPGLQEMLGIVKEKLNAKNSFIETEFDLFINKQAPVSKVAGLLDYKAKLKGELVNGIPKLEISVIVPVTTLCPCSKKISEYGAHNQRSLITLTLQTNEQIDIANLIQSVEKKSSCELYSILKRADEKFVTEKAYDNPRFVEDIVREIAAELKENKSITSFTVESENFESIHNHSAYAMISG